VSQSTKDIYSYCLDLLSRKAYSSFKLKQKLKEKQFIENEIEAVLKLLAAERYLRDDLYAESRARTWMAKGDSKSQIRRRLKHEKLSLTSERIEELYSETNRSEEIQVRKLIDLQFRKLRSLPRDPDAIFKLKKKITASVMRKGHSFQIVKTELERKMKEAIT